MKIDFSTVAQTLTAALIGWAALQLYENNMDIAVNSAGIAFNAAQIDELKERN